MNRTWTIGILLCVLAIGGLVGLQTMRAQNATKPVASAKRAEGDIVKDLDAAVEKLAAVYPSPPTIAQEKFRREKGPKVLPVLKGVSDLMLELSEVKQGDERMNLLSSRMKFLMFETALGDKEAAKALSDMAAGSDANLALGAKSSLTFGRWLATSGDAKAQEKLLEEYAGVAKANARSENVSGTLEMMAEFGATSDALADKVVQTIKDVLPAEVSTDVIAEIGRVRARQALVGKPITITGRTSTGGTFDSGALKGKVILLDFWATWCAPCKEELPGLKAFYKVYHDKGLEIVGIDWDYTDAAVNEFTKANGIPWVQLRETTQSEDDPDHPIAKKYDVPKIPAMFLIDRKGNLRHLDAGEDTEEKIKALLEEK